MNKVGINRVLCIAFTFLMLGGQSYAQYGNEWIDHDKAYYKIQVASDGAYRLFYSDLQRVGFPVESIEPIRIQLFYRGKEQAIEISTTSNTSFAPGDFIAFYGQKNDGVNDMEMYPSPAQQPHSYYNLYSDTSSYFLTWNNAVQGKRMVVFSNENPTTQTLEPYHYNLKRELYHDEYAPGYTVDETFQYTQFDEGEGWTGKALCMEGLRCTGQIDYMLEGIENGVVAGGLPRLKIALTGRNDTNHLAEIYIGSEEGALRLLTTAQFANYETTVLESSFEWTDISSEGRVIVRIKLGSGNEQDRLSVSYIQIVHPQQMTMNEQSTKKFILPSNPRGTSYMAIQNTSENLFVWDITNMDDVKSIATYAVQNALGATIPNTTDKRTLFAYDTFLVPTIKPVRFDPIVPSASDYIIISHPSLMLPAGDYNNPVQSYAAYRASPEGGMHNTLVVDINQLYDQFNYGETSPVAVYRFMRYMVDQGTPKYLFLIGKGLNVSYDRRRNTTGPADLVPSAGMPGSDMMFTAGLDGTAFVPAVATGRITANTPAQVAAYLNKIKKTEALPFDNVWRKRILHLSGGIEQQELPTFKKYMQGFADIAVQPHYGALVTTVAKREPGSYELINISKEINKGINMVTFFGHSSSSTIDIDIGFATDPVMGYANKDKYPVFLVNGCNAGAFFSYRTAFGEDWILASDKGARGFIAHSSYGLTNMLRAYTELFYKISYTNPEFLGAGIGVLQKEVAKRFLEAYSSSIITVTQIQQMVLLGDPAVALAGALKPDFEINDNTIFLEPFDKKPITALTDSFALKAVVTNLGSIKKDQVTVRVTRTFSDNTTMLYDSVFLLLHSRDTLTLVIKKAEGKNGFGNNTFEVQLDIENQIEELNENNNTATIQWFAPLRGTKNLFPLHHGLVNKSRIKLLWQNTDILSALRAYFIEVDTIPTFDSPFFSRYTDTGNVLIDHTIDLLDIDSLTYYWRTRLAEPESGENTEWAVNSFSYIKTSEEGWGQIHFPQYFDNETTDLVYDPTLRETTFRETLAKITVRTFGSNYTTPPRSSFQINGVEYNLATQFQPCRNNTINVVALNKTTLAPYSGIPFIFQDPRTCGREPQVINSFTDAEIETTEEDDLLTYIDRIEVSDSVVLFSIGEVDYSSWSDRVVNKLGELGIESSQIATLQTGEPIVIFAKKGAPIGSAGVYRARQLPGSEQALEVHKNLTGKYTSGHMRSVVIGPAQSWKQFSPVVRNVEPSDTYSFDLIGVSATGEETPLITDITESADLIYIDAARYPFLRIIMHMEDNINQSPAQLHRWIVYYTPVPEGILMPREQDLPAHINIPEGDVWTASYTFHNISNHTFPDSLHVLYKTYNKSSFNKDEDTIKIKSPAPGEFIPFTISVDTRNKAGLNDVTVWVNPRVYPEQYYDNNVMAWLDHLNVERERIIPVLDVTLDGRYVMNGDFVSPNPVILVKIWDENRKQLKKDTLGVRIILRSPCNEAHEEDCSFEYICMCREDVQWFPATETTPFRVVFTPSELAEGSYTLRVEGEDGSGNSPATPYQLHFVVRHTPSVVFSTPYPNPSGASIYFGFVVTGTTPPDFYSLHITTAEGKTVYDVVMQSNELHVGFNPSSWDGKDEQGIPMKAGLYIYRQVVSLHNTPQIREGKLLLIR